MDQTLNYPQLGTLDFAGRIKTVTGFLKDPAAQVTVEGLSGASRALFLAHLKKNLRRPIVLLTADQNTGEALLGDLKYFFRYEKIRSQPQFFPTWEILPYEHISPLSEVSGERLSILDQLLHGGCPFLVVPVEAAMQSVVPKSVLGKQVFPVKKGDSLERELLETCLMDNGYSRVHMVEDRGEFSVRGDIVDIFQSAAANPIRVEFFGDQVESLREFDISSQVSIQEIADTKILPVREIMLTPEEIQRGVDNILSFARENDFDRTRLKEVVDRIEHLGGFSGIERFAPFFYPEKENLFDYLPPETLVVVDEEDLVRAKCDQYEELIQTEYENSLENGDIASPPESFYLNAQDMKSRFDAIGKLSLNSLKLSDAESSNVVHFDIQPIPLMRGKFDALAERALEWQEEGLEVILVAPTKGHVRRVHQLLDEYGLELAVDKGLISSGFKIRDLGKVFVAESEVFGRSHKHRYRRKPKSQSFQRGFKDLKPDDFLVHVEYGIGQYMGTRELKTGVGSGEFLEILYADDEKLYIPMDGLGYIQKYMGSGETQPPLSKMGGVAWQRQKSRAKKAIQEMAEDLLKLYAARAITEKAAYTGNAVATQEFADSFEFEETDDQLKAIDEIDEDLEQQKPMDRLVCGDVGYGKTEVAMRAAFKVISDKRQVAVLVPTTILAQQHLNTFRERFRNYPVNIEQVSRFRSPRQQKETLARLSTGELDIIIGTHRILSKDVKFADLGLIIIDEEQRFGVKHKEKLKKLRASVDILTLTATPIPRTLHFSLMGVRDLSVIETPPSDRLAVKTFVRKFDEKVIREAILRELDRGGQIFFVHNKIHSIQSVQEMIHRIVPQVRIGIAHGQLPEHQLEEVMKKFMDHEVDLLLSTTIVESGLDIPSANTIIINRADQFGLAQLYQLRGRVGRYKHQAYAYLLIPGTLAITPEARKRICAIEEMSELGAGFQLAARDMEIRGVGDMLGHKQSGQISAIGFDLYCKLIEETVQEIKGEKVAAKIEPEIDFMVKGYIPKDYIENLNQRLEVYRTIQTIAELEECESLRNELLDRYGKSPEPVEKLLQLLEIRVFCQKLHISKAKLKGNLAYLTVEPGTPMSPASMASLTDDRLKFISEYQISIKIDRKGWKQDMEKVKHYLNALLGDAHRE
ncbi:MAG: transcription-repair-coupling factor [Nitrospinaceae bacterium]|nr:MAG: transcription-repair-coupling factor [Nitrospinaceae bacterium]